MGAAAGFKRQRARPLTPVGSDEYLRVVPTIYLRVCFPKAASAAGDLANALILLPVSSMETLLVAESRQQQ